jgi:hypothetical protein
MTPSAYLDRVRADVIGQKVSFRRLAGDSLLIYINCRPGDPPSDSGAIFWLEAPWHLRDQARVLAGSRQTQTDEGIRAVHGALDELRTVESVEAEPVTSSLVLRFSAGLELRTFVTDPTDELSDWSVELRGTAVTLLGSASGLELFRRTEPSDRADDES